jgi:hypothetical protein
MNFSLVLEVVIEGPDPDTGIARDLIRVHTFKPVAREPLGRRSDETPPNFSWVLTLRLSTSRTRSLRLKPRTLARRDHMLRHLFLQESPSPD